MKNLLYIILYIPIILSCSQNKSEQDNAAQLRVALSDTTENTCCPYLTKNHNGETVLVYTAENKTKESFVYFSTWDKNKNSFSTPFKIEVSKGASLHPESMAKIAFKSNGDIILAYEVKKRTSENPYGGEIHFLQSSDNGKTWDGPALVHQDAAVGRGRSFFDIATLANGEVGACWLDASNQDGARPVKFAQTAPGNGFANEIFIDSLACECCRTAIKIDPSGKINIIYRDLEVLDEENHIRDLSIAISDDGGYSFSTPGPVSQDNWKIIGCPHMGPGLSLTDNSMHVAWYTKGGVPGIYHAMSQNDLIEFSPRTLISSEGKNPQIWASNEGAAFIAYTEPVNGSSPEHEAHKHGELLQSMPLDLNPVNFQAILRIENKTRPQTKNLSNPEKNASFPVIIGDQKEGFVIVAWIEESDGLGQVFFEMILFRELILQGYK